MPISSFVAVPTLAVGDKLTASRWNTIGTALGFLLNPPEVIATNTAGTSIANNVSYVLVPFATEDVDTGPTWDGAMHDNVTNNSRTAATTGARYDYESYVFWTSTSTTGRRISHVRKNAAGSSAGGTFVRETEMQTLLNTANHMNYLRGTLTLAANDYLELFVYQNSGASLTLVTSNATFLRLRMVGQ